MSDDMEGKMDDQIQSGIEFNKGSYSVKKLYRKISIHKRSYYEHY